MKIIYNRFIPFKGFLAINLFGVLFARKGAKIDERTLCHEAIHSEQMKELLYICFYVIYFFEWLLRLFQHRFNLKEAYKSISFEKEAYANDKDPLYLDTREPFSWVFYF